MWTAVSSHPVRKAWRSQKSFLLHLLIKCRRKEISDNFKLLISLMWHKLLLFVMAYENSSTPVEFFNSQAERHAKSNIRNVGWNSSLPFTDLVWHSLNLSFSCVCGAHEGQNRAQIECLAELGVPIGQANDQASQSVSPQHPLSTSTLQHGVGSYRDVQSCLSLSGCRDLNSDPQGSQYTLLSTEKSP